MRALLIILFSFYISASYSQTEKGSLLVNLNGAINHFTFTEEKFTEVYGDSRLGYAYFDDLFIGVQFRPKYAVTNLSSLRPFFSLSYGIFLRYYFLNEENRIYLHSDLNHDRSNFDRFSISANSWNIGVGYNYFLSKNISLETNLYYSIASNLFTNDNSFGGYDVPKRLNLSFGVNYFLNKNNEKLDLKDKRTLENNYLKKGNKSIALQGLIIFKKSHRRANISISIFLKNNFEIDNDLFVWNNFDQFGNISGSYIHSTSIRPYYLIGHGLYFTPKIGIGPTLRRTSFGSSNIWGINGFVEVGFQQFYRRSIIGAGIKFHYFKNFGILSNPKRHRYFFLNWDFFINKNISVKPQLILNLTDNLITLLQLELDRLEFIDRVRLQFGLNYYFQKKKKDTQ